MQTLRAGVPVRITPLGRTLSIVNDPIAFAVAKYAPAASVPVPFGFDLQDLSIGSVLVGFDVDPTDPMGAGTAVIVPAMMNATIPVPPSTGFVSLLYPGRQNMVNLVVAGPTYGYEEPPIREDARTLIGGGAMTTKSIVVATAWSDVDGPLAVYPIGRSLPQRLVDYAGRNELVLPFDAGGAIMPPSAQTPVYDQALGSGSGSAPIHGPYFRPHLAPSGSAVGTFNLAANTPADLTLAPDILNVPAPPPAVRLAVILRMFVSVFNLPSGPHLSIGPAALAAAGGAPALVGFVPTVVGLYAFAFGEGVAVNFDGGFGRWGAVASGVVGFDLTVVYG